MTLFNEGADLPQLQLLQLFTAMVFYTRRCCAPAMQALETLMLSDAAS